MSPPFLFVGTFNKQKVLALAFSEDSAIYRKILLTALVSTEYLQYLVSPPPCLRVVAAAGWSQRRPHSGVMKPSFLGPRLTNLNLINALPSTSSRPARVSVVTEETKRCAAGTQNRVSQKEEVAIQDVRRSLNERKVV